MKSVNILNVLMLHPEGHHNQQRTSLCRSSIMSSCSSMSSVSSSSDTGAALPPTDGAADADVALDTPATRQTGNLDHDSHLRIMRGTEPLRMQGRTHQGGSSCRLHTAAEAASVRRDLDCDMSYMV